MSRRFRAATMLFKPLAYASTLDPRFVRLRYRIGASFVEAFWSPALATDTNNRRQKQPSHCTASITASKRARTFLSQAGPRFSSRSSSS